MRLNASPFWCISTANQSARNFHESSCLMAARCPFNGSPEYCTLLAEQMGRPCSVELTPEEEASFFAALEDMDRLYRDGLRKRAN